MRGCSEIDARLAPVHPLLLKLKKTTPESLPPYNPRMRSKTHAQVLQGRLSPIGDFIVGEILAREPEHVRGQLELSVCRHIAAAYWPLPVTESTHLHIMAVYRNAQFKATLG